MEDWTCNASAQIGGPTSSRATGNRQTDEGFPATQPRLRRAVPGGIGMRTAAGGPSGRWPNVDWPRGFCEASGREHMAPGSQISGQRNGVRERRQRATTHGPVHSLNGRRPQYTRCNPSPRAPPGGTDACARPVPSGTKQKCKAKSHREELCSDVSWAPFAKKKKRHSESCCCPPPPPPVQATEKVQINTGPTPTVAQTRPWLARSTSKWDLLRWCTRRVRTMPGAPQMIHDSP